MSNLAPLQTNLDPPLPGIQTAYQLELNLPC